MIAREGGEIDFISYSVEENILLAAEYKLVRDSFELKHFRTTSANSSTPKKHTSKNLEKRAIG